MPMARRMVFATLRWLTGRSVELFECWTWPMAEVKSEIREKFCGAVSLFHPSMIFFILFPPPSTRKGERGKKRDSGEDSPCSDPAG